MAAFLCQLSIVCRMEINAIVCRKDQYPQIIEITPHFVAFYPNPVNFNPLQQFGIKCVTYNTVITSLITKPLWPIQKRCYAK